MSSREELIDTEARELWRTLRNEEPPASLAGSDLLIALIGQAPSPDYDRLQSRHLRDSQISRPRA
jgi:hypothetical protein